MEEEQPFGLCQSKQRMLPAGLTRRPWLFFWHRAGEPSHRVAEAQLKMSWGWRPKQMVQADKAPFLAAPD